MPKAISHDSIEGELITADEWNEDQFNPKPDRYANARENLKRQQQANPLYQAAQGQQDAIRRQEMFNRGMDTQQQGFDQGFRGGILGGLFGGGGFL